MSSNMTARYSLRCSECGREIVAGQRRSPTPGGTAHDACIAEASGAVLVREDGSVTIGEETIPYFAVQAMFDDNWRPGEQMPSWLVESLERGLVRPGKVGRLTRYRDGHYEFELADELEAEIDG